MNRDRWLKRNEVLVDALKQVYDEADHILGTESQNRDEVASANAVKIMEIVSQVVGQSYPEPTLQERAKRAGIESYNVALPLPWVRKVEEMLSYMDLPNLGGHIVWSYDDFPNGNVNISGTPAAVTPTGQAVLGALALHATGGMR